MGKTVNEGAVETTEEKTIGEEMTSLTSAFDDSDETGQSQETSGDEDESQEEGEDQDITADDDDSEEGEDSDEEDSSDDDFEDTDEDNEIDKILKPKKDSVQKRIDKLTAEKKALEERNKELESKSKLDKIEEFTPRQLKGALQKAMDDSDSGLAMEIIQYMTKQEGDKRIKKYEDDVQAQSERARLNAIEWSILVKENKEFTDASSDELFPGSRADLNLAVPNSLLNQLAFRLYSDPERNQQYQVQGGQRLAVADAFKMILKSKRQKGNSKEVKRLNKKLSRMKRKNSLPSTKKTNKGEKHSSKPLSDEDKLAEYIKERKTPFHAKK